MPSTAHSRRSVNAHDLNSSQRCCCRNRWLQRLQAPPSYMAGAQPRATNAIFQENRGGSCQAPRTGLLWHVLLGLWPHLGRPTPSWRPLGGRSLLECWGRGGGTPAWGLRWVSCADLARSLGGDGRSSSPPTSHASPSPGRGAAETPKLHRDRPETCLPAARGADSGALTPGRPGSGLECLTRMAFFFNPPRGYFSSDF